MKKFMIVLLMSISMAFTFNTVRAFEVQDVSFNDYWELENLYSTYYAMHINANPIIDFTTDIEFTIPDFSDNINSYGGTDSFINLYDEDSILLISYDLDDFIGIEMFGFVHLNLDQNYIYGRTKWLVETTVDYTDVKFISILVMQSFSSPPSQYWETWIAESEAYYTTTRTPVIFYYYDGDSYFTVYDTQFINNDNPITEPTDPTIMPTTESEFIGWRSINGTIYDFESLITDDMITSGVLLFFAKYSNITVAGDIDAITDNTPDSMNAFLSVLGMDDAEGYMLLFILLNIMLAVGCLLLKLKSYIFLIISMISLGIFMFMGMLQLYVIIIVIMLYILLLIGNILGTREAEE